jgi:hypothetical protein
MAKESIAFKVGSIAGAIALGGAFVFTLTSLNDNFKDKKQTENKKVKNIIKLTLHDCLVKFKRGEYHESLKLLKKINPDILTPPQKRDRLILLGDIYKYFYKNYVGNQQKLRNKYLERAQDFYKMAMRDDISPTINLKKQIERKIAHLYIYAKDWEKAYRTFKDNETLDISAEERWINLLQQGDALLHFKQPRYYQALMTYKLIADDDDCDITEIWGEAIRKKSQLLYKAAVTPEIMLSIINKDKNLNKKYPSELLSSKKKEFLDEAEKGFREILAIERLFNSKEKKFAQIGIMRILVENNLKEKAYEWANTVHFSTGSDSEKAEALYLLATLEEKNHNEQEAIKILLKSIERYERPAFLGDNATKLFELYKKVKEYENAFNIMERLMLEYTTFDRVKHYAQEFYPENDKLLTQISEMNIPQNAKNDYYRRAKDILIANRKAHPNISNELGLLWDYFDARISFLQGNIKQTEKELETLMDKKIKDDSLKNEIYFLDYLCAVKRNDPIIVICRGERYLKLFEEEKYRQNILKKLQQSYYDIGLYNAALDIAKKLYVTGLSKVKESKNGEIPKENWLSTVAKIGQCYYRVGQYAKSEQILRAYNKELLTIPEAAAVYSDWANVALHSGQVREAIRRYDVGIPKANSVKLSANMRVARTLLELERGKEIYYDRANSLLDRLGESKMLAPNLSKSLERKLAEALLNFTFNNYPSQFNNYLSNMLMKFKGEPWLEFWILKSLSPYIGKTNLSILAEKHEKTLNKEFSNNKDKTAAYNYLKRQLALINSLTKIDKSYEKFLNRKNGALYNEQAKPSNQ